MKGSEIVSTEDFRSEVVEQRRRLVAVKKEFFDKARHADLDAIELDIRGDPPVPAVSCKKRQDLDDLVWSLSMSLQCWVCCAAFMFGSSIRKGGEANAGGNKTINRELGSCEIGESER